VRCVHARVLEVKQGVDGTELTLDIRDVGAGWQGNVLGPADNPIAPVTVVRIENDRAIARTALPANRITTNTMVAIGRGRNVAPTCERYDPKNPACRGDPRFGDGKCPDPPDFNNPVCQGQLPCPDPPDRRIRACRIHRDCFGDPSCERPPDPIIARAIRIEREGDALLVVIAAGSDNGVARDWRGAVLAGETDQKLLDVEVVRIDKRQTLVRVHLSQKDLEANPRVRLTPPP